MTEDLRARQELARQLALAQAKIAELERSRDHYQRMYQELQAAGPDGGQTGKPEADLLKAVLHGMPAGVVIAEAPSGRILLSSEGIHTIFQAAAPVGTPVQECTAWQGFRPDGTPYKPQDWPLARAVHSGQVTANERIAILRLDGTCGTVNVSARPLRDVDGRVIAGVSIFHDVTSEVSEAEQVRQLHQRISDIFESIRDIFVAIDREWRFTYVNRYVAGIAGMRPEDLLGQNLWEKFPSLVGTSIERNCREAMQDRKSLRFRVDDFPGDRQYEVSLYPTAEGLTIYGRDTTDRKTAEQNLQQQRDLLNGLIESSPIGIAVFTGMDMRYVLTNPAYRTMIGRPDAQLEGRTLAEVLPQVVSAFGEETIQQVLRTGEPDHWQEFRLAPMGERKEVWINVDRVPLRNSRGEVDSVLVLIQDVTEQVLARRRIEETAEAAEVSRSKLQAILQSIAEGIIIVDPQENMLLMNPAAMEMGEYYTLGQAQEDMEHRAEIFELTDAYRGALPAQDWPIDRVMRGETFTDWELRIRRRDTGRVWYGIFSGAPIRGKDGQLQLAVVTMHNITDRKRTEQQLQELNQTLERRVAERTAIAEQRATQLQRLAGELSRVEENERRRLARILHDHLQQLLVGAKFSVSMLRGQAKENTIRESLRQVDELLNDSITASRSLTVELSPPILSQGTLAAAMRWLARWMEEKHGLIVEVRADEGADPHAEELRSLLFQAVRELLMNVVKHAGVKRAIVEMHTTDDGMVRIVVADTGVGFDPDKVGPSQDPTSGYGLFSLRERLDLMGGRMEIDSALGAGTRVTVLAPMQPIGGVAAEEAVPAAAEPAEAGRHEALRRRAARGKAIRVLLADDHDVVRNGLARLLQTQPGIQVIGQASDGQMAVDLAMHMRPDVVVMDVSMPRLDGVEATRRIMSQLPKSKVIGLSMHGEGEVAERMRRAGAVTYLAKSSAPEDLVAAIRACKPEAVHKT